jgi:hypothetical protein
MTAMFYATLLTAERVIHFVHGRIIMNFVTSVFVDLLITE